MHVRLSNVCVCMSTSWSERYRRYQCVDCWFVVEETQKFLSICRREESTRESRGKSFTNIRSYQNWADAWLASDKGSCFEQEKLLPLHEEDVWHSLSITLKALSLRPFAVRSSSSSISTQLVPRCLRVRSFVIYGLSPGQTDRQVVASGRKLNLRRDLRWVAKRTRKFPRKYTQVAKTFSLRQTILYFIG